MSFETGIFPELCKVAKVIPIFKKDDELLCENYRPISLLPIFSKIFEKVIYKRMYQFLTENNLIYDRQFGFRSKHSTNHALVSLIEEINSHLDTGQKSVGIFIDLQKAFDTVNHSILCQKLLHYGLRGNIYLLLKSFLSNRKQYVSINGYDSGELEVTCGVPQGSTLGPLLFLIYINDFRFSLDKCIASHFADDTCISYSSSKLKTIETIMNSELKRASEWLVSNRLSLNVKKSKLLIFHSKQSKIDSNMISIKLDKSKLDPEPNVKYLGVYIDENICWDHHIHKLSKDLGRSNGIISKLRHFVPKKSLLSVYYSIVYSKLLYGCSVWSLTTIKNLDTINILQKKCIRIINFAEYNSHTNLLFKENQLLKFDDIIRNEILKIIFQFTEGGLPNELKKLFALNANYYNTRNADKGGLKIPKINTLCYGSRSLRYYGPRLWNDFIKSNDVKDIRNIYQFKRIVKKKALDSY